MPTEGPAVKIRDDRVQENIDVCREGAARLPGMWVCAAGVREDDAPSGLRVVHQ